MKGRLICYPMHYLFLLDSNGKTEILIQNPVRFCKNRTYKCIAKKILKIIGTNDWGKIRISTLGSKFVFLHLSTQNCELLLKFPNPFLISPSFAKKSAFIWSTKILKNSNHTLHLKVEYCIERNVLKAKRMNGWFDTGKVLIRCANLRPRFLESLSSNISQTSTWKRDFL